MGRYEVTDVLGVLVQVPRLVFIGSKLFEGSVPPRDGFLFIKY